jgi:hypothetical protein
LNTLRTMRTLFNLGRRSQQMLNLMGPNRLNRIKSMLSFVGVVMSAVQMTRKMGVNVQQPIKNMANKVQKNTEKRPMLQASPVAEFAEEFMENIEDNQKKQK